MKATNSDNIAWLTNCPAGDQNFKLALIAADRKTCVAALDSEHLSKGARTAIQRKLNKLGKGDSAALVVAAPLEVVVSYEAEDKLMSVQLDEAYLDAVGGMGKVTKFGAMMMMLKEVLSTRGQNFAKRGPTAKGAGVDGWLKEHAPNIKRPTAYRFMHVAEAVAEDFSLPAKVSFVMLATTPVSQLSPKLRKKQDELWEFVNGTSQNSWLDRFKPITEKGGSRPKTSAPLTPEQEEEAARVEAQVIYGSLHRGLFDMQHKHAEKLHWLPVVSEDVTTQMDLHHLETALFEALKIVQSELITRDAKIIKLK